ncbi:MAG: hypothetical protein MI867_07440, partial [Pseudomonadales bacterium]|nr:hypothetical protein [Pseudomonadales bacterium]
LSRGRLAEFDETIQAVSVAAMEAGQSLFDAPSFPDLLPKLTQSDGRGRWIATGNQLAGLGALEAGVKFVAAYPITPASDCLEWIANNIETVDGHLVQAEDELAAVNMIVGAGFAGVPSMTATSGPGLSLMSEAMGLAVASETPTVILNVMRGGPSTGIPTKSEQSDLNLALYGMHGDAPHIVVSALSVEDCFATMAWAVSLATDLQTLVIVLSDQFIGQSMQVIDTLPEAPYKADLQNQVHDAPEGYARYLDTDSGVSPMAIPGAVGGMYTADGLEHSEGAIPSPKMSEHQKQLDKRLRKLEQYDFGSFGIESEGDSEHVVLCWGSLHGSAMEAQQLLREKGVAMRVVSLRQLAPLPIEPLTELMTKAATVLVVEQNHQGQFGHYLRAQGIPGDTFSTLAQAGPTLITPQQIAKAVEQQLARQEQLDGGEQP